MACVVTANVDKCAAYGDSPGRLPHDDASLARFWPDSDGYTEDTRAALLRLLHEFGLAIPARRRCGSNSRQDGDAGYSLVPATLPSAPGEPQYAQLPAALHGTARAGVIEYTLKWMPRDLLSRAMARMANVAFAAHVWGTGMRVEWGRGTVGIVRQHGDRGVQVATGGPLAIMLRSLLHQALTGVLQSRYPGMHADLRVRVALPCDHRSLDVETLLQRGASATVVCDTTGCSTPTIPTRALIEGLTSHVEERTSMLAVGNADLDLDAAVGRLLVATTHASDSGTTIDPARVVEAELMLVEWAQRRVGGSRLPYLWLPVPAACCPGGGADDGDGGWGGGVGQGTSRAMASLVKRLRNPKCWDDSTFELWPVCCCMDAGMPRHATKVWPPSRTPATHHGSRASPPMATLSDPGTTLASGAGYFTRVLRVLSALGGTQLQLIERGGDVLEEVSVGPAVLDAVREGIIALAQQEKYRELRIQHAHEPLRAAMVRQWHDALGTPMVLSRRQHEAELGTTFVCRAHKDSTVTLRAMEASLHQAQVERSEHAAAIGQRVDAAASRVVAEVVEDAAQRETRQEAALSRLQRVLLADAARLGAKADERMDDVQERLAQLLSGQAELRTHVAMEAAAASERVMDQVQAVQATLLAAGDQHSAATELHLSDVQAVVLQAQEAATRRVFAEVAVAATAVRAAVEVAETHAAGALDAGLRQVTAGLARVEAATREAAATGAGATAELSTALSHDVQSATSELAAQLEALAGDMQEVRAGQGETAASAARTDAALSVLRDEAMALRRTMAQALDDTRTAVLEAVQASSSMLLADSAQRTESLHLALASDVAACCAQLQVAIQDATVDGGGAAALASATAAHMQRVTAGLHHAEAGAERRAIALHAAIANAMASAEAVAEEAEFADSGAGDGSALAVALGGVVAGLTTLPRRATMMIGQTLRSHAGATVGQLRVALSTAAADGTTPASSDPRDELAEAVRQSVCEALQPIGEAVNQLRAAAPTTCTPLHAAVLDLLLKLGAVRSAFQDRFEGVVAALRVGGDRKSTPLGAALALAAQLRTMREELAHGALSGTATGSNHASGAGLAAKQAEMETVMKRLQQGDLSVAARLPSLATEIARLAEEVKPAAPAVAPSRSPAVCDTLAVHEARLSNTLAGAVRSAAGGVVLASVTARWGALSAVHLCAVRVLAAVRSTGVPVASASSSVGHVEAVVTTLEGVLATLATDSSDGSAIDKGAVQAAIGGLCAALEHEVQSGGNSHDGSEDLESLRWAAAALDRAVAVVVEGGDYDRSHDGKDGSGGDGDHDDDEAAAVTATTADAVDAAGMLASVLERVEAGFAKLERRAEQRATASGERDAQLLLAMRAQLQFHHRPLPTLFFLLPDPAGKWWKKAKAWSMGKVGVAKFRLHMLCEGFQCGEVATNEGAGAGAGTGANAGAGAGAGAGSRTVLPADSPVFGAAIPHFVHGQQGVPVRWVATWLRKIAPYLRDFGPVLLTAIRAVNMAVSGGVDVSGAAAGLQAANKFLGESLSTRGVDELQAAVQFTLDAAASENSAGGGSGSAGAPTTAAASNGSFGATARVANARVQALVKKHVEEVKCSSVADALGLHDMYTRTGQRVYVCAACRMRAKGTLLDFDDLDEHLKTRVSKAPAASHAKQVGDASRPSLRVRRVGGGTLQGMVHFARVATPRPPSSPDVAAASGVVAGVTTAVGVLEVSPCDAGDGFTVSMYFGPNIEAGGTQGLPPESRLARLVSRNSIGGSVTVVGWLGRAGGLVTVPAVAVAGDAGDVAGATSGDAFHFTFHDASNGVATYVRAPALEDARWWWDMVLKSSM